LGEDGLAGISDDKQQLCFALALWNGKDPILKERLFGLTNSEGNHGEDVKEYYFYVDSTPTHSYMKCLYKYPQAAFPYDDLVETNRRRTRKEFEYELLDTGVFNDDRYFDVFVEYAKDAPEDILIKITVCNRGSAEAELHLLPTLWFRNTWARWIAKPAEKPALKQIEAAPGTRTISVTHPSLGAYRLHCGDVPLLFTDNETNNARLFPTFPNDSPWVKDGINDYVVHGRQDAVNPVQKGTKASAHYRLKVGGGQSVTLRLRLTRKAPATQNEGPRKEVFGAAFDEAMALRLREADAFYAALTPASVSTDEARVMRQALAGMLWSKQYYYFDLDDWLTEHHANVMRGGRNLVRNRGWFHMVNDGILSVPDKWEYPWYAAWDLAFHTIALNMVDHDFAREQLDVMLSELYLHPSGQIPAYEWNFSDVNPPVHAFATLFNYVQDEQQDGCGDLRNLKENFSRLLLNFTWWVNRKDPEGRNVFEGGFLGLDNIGVFDRSAPLPTGGSMQQADGTAWMCFFCQNMIELALELAKHDSSYQDIAAKFVEHFFWIASAMDRIGVQEDELWDEEDGFFYDVLRFTDGSVQRIKTRSIVGLLPLCATTVLPSDLATKYPEFAKRLQDFVARHRYMLANIQDPTQPGAEGRYLLSICDETKLRRILTRMLDEERFLSPFGIRSLSKWHEQHPFGFDVHGQHYEVKYLPAESDSGMFGGNSNWRGPVWVPLNLMIMRGLMQSYLYYGDRFKIECPTGSGRMMTLFEVAMEIACRLTRIFLKDENGRRPVYGGTEKFQTDEHWRDHILFYEYFHGDNGAGLGASHQTGWTGLVAKLIQLLHILDPQEVLKKGYRPVMQTYAPQEMKTTFEAALAESGAEAKRA